ncbi:histidine kinase [Micrococcus sp. XM4230B]|uniref:sensor histidine kinase n=1 Tax=Micrococcus sp. XM4230B TaxID=2929775 RepID=UPI001FF9B643|nr:histidine kinase [Micrococcus sp. XM4230B]MCK1799785.1 histidine kinase [Micrococcus sp. XM4230B]
MPDPSPSTPSVRSGAPFRARRSSSWRQPRSLRWGAFWAAAPLSRVYLAFGSAFLLASTASDIGLFGPGHGAIPVLDGIAIASATSAFLAQWWRSTVGFALLLPGAVATVVGGSEVLFAVVAPVVLGAVAATARSWGFVVTAAVLALTWGVAQPFAVGQSNATWFILLLMSMGLGGGLFIRESLTRQERARLAAEAERRSLARDLHDVVAHNLTIISMQARTARYLGAPEAAQGVLDVVGDSAKDALRDLRRMLSILQEDGIVDPSGEPGAAGGADGATSADPVLSVAQLAEELRSLGMTVETDVRCDQNAMPISVRSTLHRVLQEATTNVAKHAGEGARVCIELRDAGPDVVLEVENTVTERSGPPQWNSSGVGLNSMRDRVATFGGTIEAGPGGWGWRVRAVLPRSV